jgi:Phosphotransferase enzyme family
MLGRRRGMVHQGMAQPSAACTPGPAPQSLRRWTACPSSATRAHREVRRTACVCHRDFAGDNLLLAHGHLVAILDWEQTVAAPREHDLWTAAELPDGESFLTEYGARDLDLDHIEYALLSRALRDMAARVLTDTDEPGVDRWGFRRLVRLTRDLTLFRPFCA